MLLLVKRYFNHSQCTKRMNQKLYFCVMCMHEYYLCSTELLIWWPFGLYIYIMWKYRATGISHTPPVKSFHKRIYRKFKMRPWVLNSQQLHSYTLTHRVRDRRTDNNCNIHVVTPHFMNVTHSMKSLHFAHTQCNYTLFHSHNKIFT